ncbi:MAG: hypothetical protein HFJ72_05395 [Adlercreutzia sp.]|nr:hypothetical protein [Adlercreutzia sp.]
MNVTATIKKAGQRRALGERTYETPFSTATLESLLRFLVGEEYRAFQERAVNPAALHALTQEEIDAGAGVGKVSLRPPDPSAQTLEQSQEIALNLFRDGLLRVFSGTQELTSLESVVDFSTGDKLSIIRMTFLTGTLW